MTIRRCAERMPTVSLFPFFSVLLCAMGVMLVVVCGQVLASLGGSLEQVIDIPGSVELDSVWVECRKEEVVIYELPGAQRVPSEELERLHSRFQQLLDRLEARPGQQGHLVLLVRPDGIGTFD